MSEIIFVDSISGKTREQLHEESRKHYESQRQVKLITAMTSECRTSGLPKSFKNDFTVCDVARINDPYVQPDGHTPQYGWILTETGTVLYDVTAQPGTHRKLADYCADTAKHQTVLCYVWDGKELMLCDDWEHMCAATTRMRASRVSVSFSPLGSAHQRLMWHRIDHGERLDHVNGTGRSEG